MNWNEWVHKQVEYRFGNPSRFFYPKDDLLDAPKVLRTFCVFDSLHCLFKSVNGFDKIIDFDKDLSAFSRSANAIRGKGRRQAYFANLVLDWNIKSIFYTNWCDAQGWEYDAIFPELKGLPIIQFSRRKDQRGKVVLFPLNREFMGYGGKNIPKVIDDLDFKNKANKVVWRGRYSGTLSDWKSEIFWAESIFRDEKELTEANYQHHLSVPRCSFVKNIFDLDFVDAGFYHNKKESDFLTSYKSKSSLVLPYLKERLSLQQQFEAKFILALPGNDYPSSLYWSLMSNSVVFMLEHEWETALDCGLEPWVHYVPIKNTKDDLQSKYELMMANYDQCLDIINNAHKHMELMVDPNLRDAADWLTLKKWESSVIPVHAFKKSFSR